MNLTHLRCHFALLLAMVLWGSSFVALKVAVSELPPMLVLFLRMLIGSLGFLAAWPWVREGLRYQRGDWRLLLLMALCEPCLYFVFEANGLRFTSAGQAGMVTALLPLFVAVAAWFYLGERNGLRQWAGFTLAVIGVIGMTLAGDTQIQAPNPWLGNLLQMLAMLCATGYTLLVKQLLNRYSAFTLTALQCFVGLPFFLPLAVFSDWPAQVSLGVMAIVVYLGLIITLGTYGLYNYSLVHLKASVAAGYTNLLPVFALLFSMLLLGERMTSPQWLFIALIFTGVILSQYHHRSTLDELPPSVSG